MDTGGGREAMMLQRKLVRSLCRELITNDSNDMTNMFYDCCQKHKVSALEAFFKS